MTALDIRRVLARNTAWNYAGFAINLATNLVMFPFVVHRLGDAAAGVWLVLSSITGYMGLLELGIVPSLTQTIASSLARGERGSVGRAASTSRALLVGLSAVSLLILLAGSLLVRVFHVPESLHDGALAALRVAVVGFALRMPLATYQAILLGCQRQDRCNQLWIATGAAKFLAAAAVIAAGYGLVGLVASEALVHLAAGVLQVRWVYDEIPDLRLSLDSVNRVDATRLLSFGGAILAVTVCSLVIEQTDRLVIAAFLPVAMVTYYAAAWKIYMLAYALTTTVVQAMSPLAADLHGRNDGEALRSLFLRTTKYSAMIAWPLVLSLSLGGGFLLRVWMGEPFVRSLAVVQVLVAGFAVTAHNHAGYSALIGIRRVGPTVWQYFVPQAVLNLMLSIWLAQRLGIVGVAFGTMVPALALEYFFLRFVLNELRVDWTAFFSRAVLPAASSALLAYSPLLFAYSQFDRGSWLLALVALACGPLYASVIWRSLDASEREDVLGFVPPGLRRKTATQMPNAQVGVRAEGGA